ncbi:hypothetical protein WS90_31210 [Burkholderia cepacia]|uniref:DNA2/NAM7 helicase helicase domain-containing protein n=1 Tax=Burkholderia cepacia TaxID=292 RepID=A0A103Z6B5_BURCE|nr:hypothetical protein WS90_31210 [Burkholderia cepacia]
MPEIPVEALAQYWCAALDFVSFDDLRDRLRKSRKLPELTLIAADAHRHGASPDAEGQPPTGTNVQVVLALWEADSNHAPQLKNRMHMLLAVPAILTEDNLLAPRTDAPPIFNGKYLDPDVESYGFRIAHRDEANAAMTQQLSTMVTDPTVIPGWDTWWRTSMAVLRGLVGVDDDVALLTELIARLPKDRKTSNRRSSGQRRSWQLYAVVLPADGGGRGQLNATYAAALIELQREDGQLPLFERLGGGENAAWIERAPPSINQAMTGHIDEYDGGAERRGLFPLDATQRTAVGAILSLEDGEMQAVNGPPGSGKTSMLRAVVASQWVNAALEQGPCPITLACGATNQSVTNVIEAFGNAPHPDATLAHAQRWIADASSYGAYLPASSRLADPATRAEAERFVCLQETKGGFLYRYSCSCVGRAASAVADTSAVSSIATTGTKAGNPTAVLPIAGAVDCSRSWTHLRNWLAFTPAFRARPDSDAPDCRQASTSRRLSVGSKLRLPPTPTRVTRKGKKVRSFSVMDCVRKFGLRTQSWTFSNAEARCAKTSAYDKGPAGGKW